MAGSVWAVVVTYNRKTLLKGCLEALATQSQALTGLVLVDNASEDQTALYLVQQGLLSGVDLEGLYVPGTYKGSLSTFLKSIPLIYLRLPYNQGGAGGFNEGMSSAMYEGADWVWLVDDDVEPEPDCLAQLLAWKDVSKCLHPRRKLPDGSFYPWEGYLDVMTGNDVFLDDISFRHGKELCYVNFGCFEGMLVHRQIIEKIGLPDKRFFIVYDDTVYGLLASMHTNVAYVRNAVLRKMLPLPSELFTDRFIYYSMRNLFLKVQYLDQQIPRLLYRMLRKLNIIAVFFRYFVYILCKKKANPGSFKMLFKGFRDGIFISKRSWLRESYPRIGN